MGQQGNMASKGPYKTVYIALLVTFALVLHLIEQALPSPFVLPGAKLGLANIITLLALIIFGFKDGLMVAILRTFLGSLLAGTIFGFPFYLSFTGAVVSTLVMQFGIFLKNKGLISLIGVSLLGASSHNIAQLVVASIIMNQFGIFFVYLPYLLAVAIPTGFFTGLATIFLERIVRNNLSKVVGSS
ncbi:Gx transporter family protein [Natranaerofaba carboxydovora]|uniref:Gx transporter family protein n=1 Tax=Natranaerofaba carboxydovora TaxID=2742683 RepID=UPI001F13A3F7|nr:Gx transporter family protein [Natranaerofaba carboxydovora]UMZ72862.1 Heptaprenyl diphosphate synthase component I [Natranaerofaba carboxydovora]